MDIAFEASAVEGGLSQLQFYWKSKNRRWLWILHVSFIFVAQFPPELCHKIVHGHHYFHSWKLISRAHSWTSTEWMDDRFSNRDGSYLLASLKNLESKCVMLCAAKTYQVMRQKHVNGFWLKKDWVDETCALKKHTFQPLGMSYPWYLISLVAVRKLPKTGGTNRSVSIAAFHVYFILETCSHVRASSVPLLSAISSCSAPGTWYVGMDIMLCCHWKC